MFFHGKPSTKCKTIHQSLHGQEKQHGIGVKGPNLDWKEDKGTKFKHKKILERKSAERRILTSLHVVLPSQYVRLSLVFLDENC